MTRLADMEGDVKCDGNVKSVSVRMITYNHGRYIYKAVISILNQTYQNFELVISDDCSTDDTWDEIQRAIATYSGPIRIILNRNEPNLGMIQNCQKAISLCSGEIVVLHDGDDWSAPNRVERIVEAFNCDREVVMVSSGYHRVDAANMIVYSGGTTRGIKVIDPREDLLNCYSSVNYLGATLALKRSLYDRFGPMESSCKAEDIVNIKRAILCGKVAYIDESLVYYRIFGGVSKTRSDTIEQSIMHSRQFCACYRQMCHDLLRVNCDETTILMRPLQKRIRMASHYQQALGADCVAVRICHGAYYAIRGCHEHWKKRCFVLFASLLPKTCADYVFRKMYTKNLVNS